MTTYKGIEAETGIELDGEFTINTITDVNEAMKNANESFLAYKKTSNAQRATFLRKIAENIENLGEELIQRACAESALPAGRITGERGRTVGQLRLFATYIQNGEWTNPSIDLAQPDRQPMPKADIRKCLEAVGPVVVFGASNFPLAFSTAGGDTASALASGCSVVVKAHPAHPGTSELVASAIINAAKETGMPDNVFQHLHDNSFEVGSALVKHSLTKSVAFTGSFNGGKALYDIASNREEPIPVFAEMGSINPVLLLPDYLNNNTEKAAEIYAGSVTLGAGQFCTNPGLIIGLKGEGLNSFAKNLSEKLKNSVPQKMLNKGIYSSFKKGLSDIYQNNGLSSSEVNNDEENEKVIGSLARVEAKNFVLNSKFHEELFGPFTLIVECENEKEMADVISSIKGQLTGTVMGENSDFKNFESHIESLKNRVGRILFNGAPTGVEVCHSMHHGGPFPSTTDSRFTSVGTDAVLRFVRPVCFQNCPEFLLPEVLRNENTTGATRLVDGVYTTKSL